MQQTPDQELHNTISFNGQKGIVIKTCPRCHRRKWLGVCGDGCEMCQSCYHSLHGLAPLPSDFMELPTRLTVKHFKEFDWERARQTRSPIEFVFIESFYKTGATEKEFMDSWEALRRFVKKEHRCPAWARYQYRSLRDKFDFFNPNEN